MKLDSSIFYIKYYATKYGETIERKGTLDGVARGEFISKRGYPCFNYLDIWAPEKFGKPHYRTASKSLEFNDTATLDVNHIDSVLN